MAGFFQRRPVDPGEFGVEEANIKRRIVNDQFGILDKIQEFRRNLLEAWFVLEKLSADTVYSLRAGIDFPFGIKVVMEVAVCQAAVDHLDTANFDDAVSEFVFKAGGFGIKKNLSHEAYLTVLSSSIPRLASRSTRSLPGLPA